MIVMNTCFVAGMLPPNPSKHRTSPVGGGNDEFLITPQCNATVPEDLPGFKEGIQDSLFSNKKHSIDFVMLDAVPHIQFSKVLKELLSAALGTFIDMEFYHTIDLKPTF